MNINSALNKMNNNIQNINETNSTLMSPQESAQNISAPNNTNNINESTYHPYQTSSPHPTIAPIPVLNLNRELLFPSAVAHSIGLDPKTHALLEIPNGSTSLYNSLLQYAANYAVDLNEPLPSVSSEIDPSSPHPASETKACNDSATNTSSGTAKNEDYFVDYDLASQFPELSRGVNGVNVPQREGAGRISSLWNCPEDRCDPLTYSDSESDTDSDVDSITEAAISAALSSVKLNGKSSFEEKGDEHSVDEHGHELSGTPSLGALRKKTEPPIQRYQMGIGYSKVLVGTSVVYIHHCAFGLPVSESYSVQVFRTIALVSEDSFPLKELCAVALKWRSDREQRSQTASPGRFTLFRWKTNGSGSGDWVNQGYKRSRPARSVILAEGQLETIVRDMRDFIDRDTKAWYLAHGLPHRRSFLFHGPPGSGKSSTVKMIAGMFRLNACFLGLTTADFSNQVLQDAISTMPRRALLVLEDVDVLFNEERKSETGHSLTFSGVLNALDGLISVDGIITIFTTNHIENLDPALIRGGRVDRKFEFSHPSTKQLTTLFKSFYEDASDELAKRFSNKVLERPEEEARSIATLQQHFIYSRKMSAEKCIELIPQFFAEFYPNGGRTKKNHIYI